MIQDSRRSQEGEIGGPHKQIQDIAKSSGCPGSWCVVTKVK